MNPDWAACLHTRIFEFHALIQPVASGKIEIAVCAASTGFLRLLHVFVVSERQPLHGTRQAGRGAITVRSCPRISSSRSGFFFCGMALLARGIILSRK